MDASNPLDLYIILNQLFQLFSAVGSVSQMKKTGKNTGFFQSLDLVKSRCEKWATEILPKI